jgi:hypothetical protein
MLPRNVQITKCTKYIKTEKGNQMRGREREDHRGQKGEDARRGIAREAYDRITASKNSQSTSKRQRRI